MKDVKMEIIMDLMIKECKKIVVTYPFIKIDEGAYLGGDEFYIFLISNYDMGDFEDKCLYEVYLKDFERQCMEFIKELQGKLVKHLSFSDFFYHNHKDYESSDLYNGCNLNFMIDKEME